MRPRTSSTSPLRRGFTLLEIVVVVTIIAILATLIAPRIFSRIGSAKQAAASAEIATITQQVRLYLLDLGRSAPDDDFDLSDLLLTPEEGGGPDGPYFEKADDLIDPWGNEYVIRIPGEVNVSFDIVSWGEDGQPGGEPGTPNEDITN